MNLRKFVDALPIPSVLKPNGRRNQSPYYEITMVQTKQKLHRDLPPTTVWGYNGLYPGPTIEAKHNEAVYVKWKNDLPYEHLLPVDRTIHGAHPDTPSVRTVVHLHGGRVRPESDGYPEAWFTKGFTNVGPKFVQEVYHYPNCQRPATLWYHDHAIGITRLNVYAGLAGLYILRDEKEQELNLPKGEYEIPLLIQDRSFYPNGQLFYPTGPDSMPPHGSGGNSHHAAHGNEMHPPSSSMGMPNPSIVPEFFGDTILVNGKVWPYVEVEPRKYRFRVANGSNARFYRIALSSGQTFTQIGTDGGFLEEPVEISELILAPAERADIIVDFANHKGQKIILTNSAPAPFPNGEPPTEDLSQIMEFRVKTRKGKTDTSSIPKTLGCLERLRPMDAVRARKNTLIETTDEYGRLLLLLNGMRWDDHLITETPANGEIEIWELYNLTNDSHPMHLHLVDFQIIDRAPFTGDPDGPNLIVGESIPPDENERGWKDTVRANPGEVTRIIARFGPYTGIYPWHCHILEHEDHDMMRPYEVLQNPSFNPVVIGSQQCPDDSFANCFEEEKHSASEELIARGKLSGAASRYYPHGYHRDQ